MASPLAVDALSESFAATQDPKPLPWRVFVAETTTGRIVADVSFAGSPQWSYGVNATGSLQVTVPVDGIGKTELRALLDYWRLSWGVSWGAHIFQCGPLVTHQFSDEDGPPTVTVGAAGIWSLLATKRVVANPSFTGRAVVEAAADTTLSGLSLHTIAKRLVQNDLTRNGSLPIVLPSDIAGTAERYYPGYDLAYVGERLQQLTQVIDGPEVEFRPRYTDSTQTYVEWEMRTGNPRLGNLGAPHSWDYGAALARLDEDGDGSAMSFRSWSRGNGMERGLLVGYYEDMTMPGWGWPVMETVDSEHTSATEMSTLDGWAEATVRTYQRPVIKLAGRVRIDGTDGQGHPTGSPAVDQVQAGDTCIMTVRGHRLLADGAYRQRIIGVSSADMHTATLTLQEVA